VELSSRNRLKEIIRTKLRERNTTTNEETTTANVDGYQTPFAFGKNTQADKERKAKSSGTGYELAENRWLALKRDETRSPEQKINLGVREIKNQLAEVERFLGWYNKLKTENGVKNEDFYKRTNTSIFRIKERLNKIARTIIDF
jgi:hypothetical protein